MTTSRPEASQKKLGSARFAIGSGVFAVGMMCPLLVPLVAASDLAAQWKATLSGMLLLGAPEVLMLVAVAIMGKPGYEEMKRRLLGLLRQLRPAQEVGLLRTWRSSARAGSWQDRTRRTGQQEHIGLHR